MTKFFKRHRYARIFSAVVLAMVVVSLALAGCSKTTEQTAAKQQFNLGHLNSTAHVLAFVAQEEGYFSDEGLEANLTQFSSGSELVSGLESGKLDAAFIGSVPAIVNQASGHDVTIFGGAMSNGHGYVIKSKYTQGLGSWDVSILKGKNVAVPRNTVQDLELQQILTKYGLTWSTDEGAADVHIVYFDSQKDAYAALANDQIDAVSCYSPYTSVAVAAGYSIVYQCSDIDIFHNQPCCRQVASTSALQAQPQKFEAFERALIKAYDFYKTNHDQTVADVKKYIDIPDDEIAYELYQGYADSNPDPDKRRPKPCNGRRLRQTTLLTTISTLCTIPTSIEPL